MRGRLLRNNVRQRPSRSPTCRLKLQGAEYWQHGSKRMPQPLARHSGIFLTCLLRIDTCRCFRLRSAPLRNRISMEFFIGRLHHKSVTALSLLLNTVLLDHRLACRSKYQASCRYEHFPSTTICMTTASRQILLEVNRTLIFSH